MKTLSCNDLGTPECDFVAKAETAEETMAIMMGHAMSVHKDKIDEIAKTMSHEQIGEMMMSKVKDEA